MDWGNVDWLARKALGCACVVAVVVVSLIVIVAVLAYRLVMA